MHGMFTDIQYDYLSFEEVDILINMHCKIILTKISLKVYYVLTNCTL